MTTTRKLKPHDGVIGDIYPIPGDKRTYGVYAYIAYWGKLVMTLRLKVQANPSRHLRSLLVLLHHRIVVISVGLTAWQAMLSMCLGMLFACCSTYLSGVAGAKFHLGYGAFARAAWVRCL
jgi:cytosine/uracil/thiamine/allantoin permease